MKLDPYLTAHIKIKSKRTKGLNIRANTVKLLGKIIGINLHDLGFMAIIS